MQAHARRKKSLIEQQSDTMSPQGFEQTIPHPEHGQCQDYQVRKAYESQEGNHF
jgi:hypothetical protein